MLYRTTTYRPLPSPPLHPECLCGKVARHECDTCSIWTCGKFPCVGWGAILCTACSENRRTVGEAADDRPPMDDHFVLVMASACTAFVATSVVLVGASFGLL